MFHTDLEKYILDEFLNNTVYISMFLGNII